MNDYSDLIFLMGAMVLFSIFANNANDTMVRSSALLIQSEIEYSAIALTQNILDEARVKSYDHAVAISGASEMGSPLPGGVPNGFTAVGSLGPEAGETYPNFNDFDDYHNLSITRETEYGVFTVRGVVIYVTEAAPAVNAGTRTTMKRLTVTVSHPELVNPLTASYVKTYY